MKYFYLKPIYILTIGCLFLALNFANAQSFRTKHPLSAKDTRSGKLANIKNLMKHKTNALHKQGVQQVTTSTSIYVNDNSTAGDVYTTAIGDDNNVGTAAAPVATIQHAISIAQTGDVIYVDAGTYRENIIIDRSGLDIRGANYNIDPNTGTRVNESVIQPGASDADYTNSFSSVIYFDDNYSDVSLNGLTIDGDNDLITGDSSVNGVNVDACDAITHWYDGSGIHINNNIIQNFNYTGIDIYLSGTQSLNDNSISNNKLDNIDSRYAIGILIYNDFYADITYNVLTRQHIGIQTGNFYLAKATPGNPAISNNQVESRVLGIWHNLAYSAASTFDITNNTLTTVTGATENEGIEISSLQISVATNVMNNNISGANVGIDLWNNPTSSTVNITGGSLTNCTTGVFANNYDGYNSNGESSNYVINGVSVSGSTTGIYVKDNSLNTNGATTAVTITGNVVLTSCATGIKIEGAGSSVSFSGSNAASISGGTVYLTQVTNTIDVPAQNIDATQVLFEGVTGTTMSAASLFATEDKIIHKMDDLSLGFVTVKNNNDFVTASSGNVQRGVDLAATGWMVNVADAVYNEDVVVNKALTLQGQSLNAVIKGLNNSNANTLFIAASNVTVKDLGVTRDYGSTLSGWYASLKNQGVIIGQLNTGVVLDHLYVFDNRNAIYINNAQNNTIQNCIIENNRTGVHFANDVSGCTVKNNVIRNNFTHGVLLNYDTPPGIVATNVTVTENSITGNWYSQVNFQHNNTGIPYGDHSGLMFNCNWYGTAAPKAVAAAAGEPGYTGQVPSQFGGTDPNLNRQLYGTEIALSPYIPWLVSGTDTDPVTDGFQGTGNCNGTLLVASISSVTDAGCYGSSTGAVDISVSGGGTPYAYSWSNGATTEDITNVPSGSYTVIITDSYGQKDTLNATVNESSTPVVASSSAGTISCYSGSTSVVVSASGGIPPYSGTGTFTVGAGPYSFTVTDANGCTGITTGTVTQPTQLVVNAVPGTISCPGGTTTVAVSASGGTPPYSGVGSFTASAGLNTYMVTDANGCSASKTINIPNGTGTAPAKPGAIAGAKYGLCGSNNRTYSIDPVPNATSYVWTVPAGFSVQQNNGVSAVIHFPSNFTTSAQISVAAVNACGTSAQRTLAIYAVAPNPSSAINGPTMVSPNQVVTYTLPNSTMVYTWGVPAGASIVSGQGTSQCKVKFGTHSGKITVFVSNACGNSPTGRLSVTVGSAIVAKTLEGASAGSTQLTVFPNPTQGIATVSVNAAKTASYQLLILDVDGKQISATKGTVTQGANLLKVDLSNVANGMYIARLIMNDEIKTVKIYKQK